jgi:hypothetical protein
MIPERCWSSVRGVVSLATRPVLFALARALGEAWPGDVPRDMLVRPRASASLDDPTRAGIHDDLVTPRSSADGLGWKHVSINRRNRT